MKNLLYIGNNLNSEKANVSSIQVLGKLLEAEGYQLKYASAYQNKVLRFIDMIWRCLRYSNWADAVLIDTYSTQNFYYAYACSFVCKVFNVPYYPILHGGNLPERLKTSPKLSKSIFNNSQKNISASLYLKAAFEAQGFSNIDFIPNTIQLKNYKVKQKDYSSIKLFWLRSFSKIYNPEMAIEVLKYLQDLGYKAELCMVGPDADGSLKNIKALAEKLQVNVRFTGKLTKDEWIALAAGYNIFINTTNFDNLPVSVLEAMALGFPIISTNVGGLPFLITDKTDGVLVNPNAVEEMSKAIINVFESKGFRSQLSENARKKAEKYKWETVKQLWDSVFKSL